jgi:ABC-type transport system substrate-binding protein/class 3 adenylate cyclase
MCSAKPRIGGWVDAFLCQTAGMVVTEGERRVVAVLMADVAGSTAIGERLGPERSKFLFDEVARLMAEQVERYEGTVAQLLGDGLLAVFGAPVAHEDDSERAVRAGLAIQRALASYSRDVAEAYGIDLRARVAVNTGPVLLTPDADGAERWNALGDTVNVTARLQSLAGEADVTLGPDTAVQVRDCFELEDLGPTELRGRSRPVDRFRVVCERDRHSRPADGPLVGRDTELAAVGAALERLADGIGMIVSVTGEPGIGKSRLAADAVAPLRSRLRLLVGRSLSYTQGFSYWPIRDLLRDWLGASATSSEARVRFDLKAALHELYGAGGDERYPFLANLLGLQEGDRAAAAQVRELSRDALHRRSLEVVADLVRSLAAERPLLLVFEDLHWADAPTLQVVESLLDLTERDALGVMLLYRSERELPSWNVGERARQHYPHRYVEVELRPLRGEVTLALAQALADAPLPEAVAELIAGRAGGNPLFVSEALRDLIERGALRRANGGWELTVDPERLEVPQLVQGILQARLDRLDAAAREAVAVAAVIGRRFGMPLLERVLDADTLPGALTELQRLDLIVEERRRPFPEYRFRHGLVQEAAYATLTDADRRALHARVGAALEGLVGDEKSPSTLVVLAHHFTVADDPAKASEYLIRAGDEARSIYADQEAIRHYRRAREFLGRIGDDRRSRETLFKIALVHHLAFNFGEAERAYDEAFACKVEPYEQPAPTERLVTALLRPRALAPGLEYISETSALAAHLFRGLLLIDRDLNVMPSLAENFRVSGDGLTYLFQLRESACWSDGEPVTAHDFVYTWERARRTSTVTAFLLEDVERAVALDDRTLEVVVREPRNYFPYILASTYAYPWPRHLCESLGEDWYRQMPLVSSGPFLLERMDDDSLTMVANPRWSGRRGNLREIEVSFRVHGKGVPDLWRTGGLDVLASPFVPDDGDESCIEFAPALGTTMIGFRTDRAPFDDVRMRRAVAATLRPVAAALLALGFVSRPAGAGGLLPPAMPGHDHNVSEALDLEAARTLLADAGHRDGAGVAPLQMVISSGFEVLQEPIAAALGQIGVRVEFTVNPRAARVSATPSQLWLSTWLADYPDPDGFFRGLLTDPDDPIAGADETRELVALLDQARASRDQDERLAIYGRVDRLLAAEWVTVIPVAYSRTALLSRPWVHGLWANALTSLRLDGVIVDRSAGAAPDAAG